MEERIKVFVVRSTNLSEIAEIVAIIISEISHLKKSNRDIKILIKPNVVGPYPPEAGVTTNPLLVKAVCEKLKNEGYIVWVGDCPGGNNINVEDTFSQTGILKFCRPFFRNINRKTKSIVVKCRSEKPIYFSSVALKSDILISMAKFKTSCYMMLTGAVKNIFGIIPGVQKAQLHQEFVSRDEFGELLLEISLVPHNTIAVIDGREVMQGDGPVHGQLRQENLYIISKSIYAADFIMAKLMGFNEDEVPTIKASINRGLLNINNIEIISSEPFKCLKNFIKPITFVEYKNKVKNKNHPILNNIAKITLIINKDICVRCGICANNCPTSSIRLDPFPIINYDNCIRCFCCNELCTTGAIKIEKNIQKLWNSILTEESRE